MIRTRADASQLLESCRQSLAAEELPGLLGMEAMLHHLVNILGTTTF